MAAEGIAQALAMTMTLDQIEELRQIKIDSLNAVTPSSSLAYEEHYKQNFKKWLITQKARQSAK